MGRHLAGPRPWDPALAPGAPPRPPRRPTAHNSGYSCALPASMLVMACRGLRAVLQYMLSLLSPKRYGLWTMSRHSWGLLPLLALLAGARSGTYSPGPAVPRVTNLLLRCCPRLHGMRCRVTMAPSPPMWMTAAATPTPHIPSTTTVSVGLEWGMQAGTAASCWLSLLCAAYTLCRICSGQLARMKAADDHGAHRPAGLHRLSLYGPGGIVRGPMCNSSSSWAAGMAATASAQLVQCVWGVLTQTSL
jgi:hypothetical protein